MTRLRLVTTATAIAATALTPAACAASSTPTATATTPDAAAPTAPVRAAASAPTVVARKLNNPRQISIGADGSLYVAEAGAAGTICRDTGGSCFGFTGSITRIRNGRATRVVRGLTSLGASDGANALGAHGVSVLPDGSLYVAMTALPSCDPPPSGVPSRARGQLGRLLRYKRGLTSVADLLPAECRTNPDGDDKEIDPYAVLALSKDRQLVADAGANLVWDVRKGRVSVFAVIPGRQSVPTAITTGPDGAIYVGAFAQSAGTGNARVFRIRDGGKPTVYARGFTAITGIAFGTDRSLFVTELSTDLGSNSARGAVIRVKRDGTRTRLGGSTLDRPSGAAVDRGGALYVSNFSTEPATGAPDGEGGRIIRFAGASS